MTVKFIPEADLAFAQMAEGFANRIAAAPSCYFLSAADAELISRVVREYRAALGAVSESPMRTAVAMATKNDCRVSAEQVIRTYGALIRANQGVSRSDKLRIGVRMRPTTLSRRHAPLTSPLLKFVAATFGVHELRYADSMAPESPAKSFGARALQLFVAISAYGEKAIVDPEQAKYVGEYGRNPIGVAHKSEDGGKTATYFARWVGARNEHGPWSLPVSATVMFAGSPVKGDAVQPGLKMAA